MVLYDCSYILWLAQGTSLPPISLQQSEKILRKLKPAVHDAYNISPTHFLNAGEAGVLLFHTLITALIQYANLSTLATINTVISIILYKGHGKDPSSDRSYRTISNCTVIAKGLDAYIASIYSTKWDSSQVDTQFQAPNSSHDLAALMVSELSAFSLNVAKRPLYSLFLDAKACFDRVTRQDVIVNAFTIGTDLPALTLINNRLQNRNTILKYNDVLMGKIHDSVGVEQGASCQTGYLD